MAKKRKGADPRGPVKAKGRLPAPKISPARIRVAWYRRRLFQVLLGVIILALIGLGVRQFLVFREHSKKRATEKRAVRSFEQSLTLAEEPLQQVLQEMTSVPDELKSGKIKPEDFKTKTDKWLQDLRKIDQQLRTKKIPKKLEESRALLIQGVVVFIDAAKVFQLAGSTTDPAVRDQALQGARNLIDHAGAVYGTGRRALLLQRVRMGLVRGEEERAFLDQPFILPEEEAKPPEPPRGAEQSPPPPPVSPSPAATP